MKIKRHTVIPKCVCYHDTPSLKQNCSWFKQVAWATITQWHQFKAIIHKLFVDKYCIWFRIVRSYMEGVLNRTIPERQTRSINTVFTMFISDILTHKISFDEIRFVNTYISVTINNGLCFCRWGCLCFRDQKASHVHLV